MAIVYQNGIAGKICANPECGWKPLSEFAHARLLGIPVGDGYKSRCRECAKAQGRAERAAKLEHYRAKEREYVNAHKDHYRELKKQIPRNISKQDAGTPKHIAKKLTSRLRNAASRIWSIIAKSVENHMNDIPKSLLQQPTAVALSSLHLKVLTPRKNGRN